MASLLIDPVYEPGRRWSSKTGAFCVWSIGVDGRQVFISLSPTKSESDESCVEGWRDVSKRGLQTPVMMTTDGASGLIKAVDSLWPRSLQMGCGFHQIQHLYQQVPSQAGPACKALVADLHEAPTCEEGQRRLPQLIEQSQGHLPDACWGLAEDAEASLHHLTVPTQHRP